MLREGLLYRLLITGRNDAFGFSKLTSISKFFQDRYLGFQTDFERGKARKGAVLNLISKHLLPI